MTGLPASSRLAFGASGRLDRPPGHRRTVIARRETNLTVRRCTFRDNGQMGFGAGRAHRLLVTESRVVGNNT